MKPGSALDVGCADGLLMNELRAMGWQVRGIEAYRGNDSTNTEIVVGEFLETEMPGRFDLLTFVHSFEHMAEPVRTLAKCRSMLEKRRHVVYRGPELRRCVVPAAGKRLAVVEHAGSLLSLYRSRDVEAARAEWFQDDPYTYLLGFRAIHSRNVPDGTSGIRMADSPVLADSFRLVSRVVRVADPGKPVD
jgi:hypothetical protein